VSWCPVNSCLRLSDKAQNRNNNPTVRYLVSSRAEPSDNVEDHFDLAYE
jgi:hypothetical protein